jgi:hypothetical protein
MNCGAARMPAKTRTLTRLRASLSAPGHVTPPWSHLPRKLSVPKRLDQVFGRSRCGRSRPLLPSAAMSHQPAGHTRLRPSRAASSNGAVGEVATLFLGARATAVLEFAGWWRSQSTSAASVGGNSAEPVATPLGQIYCAPATII